MSQHTPHLYTLLTERSRALVDQRPIYAVPGEKIGDIQMWRLVARDPKTGAEAGLYLDIVGTPVVDMTTLVSAIRFANALNAYAGRKIGHETAGQLPAPSPDCQSTSCGLTTSVGRSGGVGLPVRVLPSDCNHSAIDSTAGQTGPRYPQSCGKSSSFGVSGAPRVRDSEGAKRPAKRDGAKAEPVEARPRRSRGDAQLISPYLPSVIDQRFAGLDRWGQVLGSSYE